MKRNMRKIIEGYHRRSKRRSMLIYFNDVEQIVEMSDGLREAIMKAMEAGVEIGYKAAVKDQKEGRR